MTSEMTFWQAPQNRKEINLTNLSFPFQFFQASNASLRNLSKKIISPSKNAMKESWKITSFFPKLECPPKNYFDHLWFPWEKFHDNSTSDLFPLKGFISKVEISPSTNILLEKTKKNKLHSSSVNFNSIVEVAKKPWPKKGGNSKKFDRKWKEFKKDKHSKTREGQKFLRT